jgi:hypothetical protein
MSYLLCATRLRALFQPDIPPSIVPQWRRFLHLYYAATAKVPHGNHQIKDFIKADFLEARDKVRFDLWTETPRQLIGKNVELRTALEKYIKPGVFLTPLGASEEAVEKPPKLRQYTLKHINVDNVPSMTKRAIRRGAAEIHLGPGSQKHFHHCMYKAWHKLNSGKKVEFQVHRTGGKRLPNEDELRSLIDENVHLRPDVIAKAMPRFSGTIVDPQTNFIKICWVIGPPVKTEDGYTTPINRSEGLYMRQREQHKLDEVSGWQPTKLEKRKLKEEAMKQTGKDNGKTLETRIRLRGGRTFAFQVGTRPSTELDENKGGEARRGFSPEED